MFTELSTGFSVGLAILCLFTVVFLVFTWFALYRMHRWIHGAADALARSAPASRIAEISAELTELSDAYDALLKSHKKLRSRITMRENRAKKRQDDGQTEAERDDVKTNLRVLARKQGHSKI